MEMHICRDGGAVSTWARADVECHQKSSAFKYIPFEQWRSQNRIFGGGQNRAAPGRAQEMKQGVTSGDKPQSGDGVRGQGV